MTDRSDSAPSIRELQAHFGKQIAELNGRINGFESKIESHEARIEELESMAFTAPDIGTKKGMVEIVAKYRSLDAASKGPAGGALTYPEIRDVTEAMFDESIHSQTVYNAMDYLESSYECYSVEKGPDGSKQLRIERESIPETLRNEVETFKDTRTNS